MAGDDGDDGIRYPQTINDELIELDQLPDDIDDMGDAAAALFGINAAALVSTVVAPTAAAAPSPSYAALWHRPPLVMISADLLVGLTLMKPRR
jgi:hypothetical protein